MTSSKNIEQGKWWDEAWSLVEGCTPVSPGCARCWSAAATHMRAQQTAKSVRDRYGGLTKPKGCFNGTIRLMEKDLEKPLRRRIPTTYAVWNDLFHRDVPDEFIDNTFGVMALSPQHRFLVLTKRAERMAEYLDDNRSGCIGAIHDAAKEMTGDMICQGEWPLSYVGLGTSAEDQERLHERAPYVMKTLTAVRFLSLEPLLGAIKIPPQMLRFFQWVIVGGETGPDARPTQLEWVRSIRDQCQAAGVPFFLKSLGRGKGRILDGRTWDEMPEFGTADKRG